MVAAGGEQDMMLLRAYQSDEVGGVSAAGDLAARIAPCLAVSEAQRSH
ncbi:MAG: hypothetical protein QOD35_635 [Nocardioidaceae bacterium]|nr:hypothetical protein [Nocardioidaceae bacterium]